MYVCWTPLLRPEDGWHPLASQGGGLLLGTRMGWVLAPTVGSPVFGSPLPLFTGLWDPAYMG